MYGSSLHLPVSSAPPWEMEVEIIQELLTHEPDCRLVTLVGPKGSGKTWLARRVAIRVRDAFADGVCLVRLAATPSADQLPATIAGVLGLSLSARGTLAACLLDRICAKEMLLLLDGYEHLLPEAELIDDLLRDAPRIKLLITSRVRLGLRAEWVRQMGRVNAPFARELGQKGHLESLGNLPAWDGAFLQADGGQTRDRTMSGQQIDLDKIAQTSQVASTAGW